MRNSWSTISIMALLMGSFSFSASAQFDDVAEVHPYSASIEHLRENNIVEGYEDGTFKPQNRVNRAEFTKILVETYWGENPAPIMGAECFPDVEVEWFAPYVCTAKELGLLSGYPDGTFKPAESINFAEAAKIVVETFEVLDARIPAGDVWYEKYVRSLEAEQAIPSSVTEFEQPLTRGEMAAMIAAVDEASFNLESGLTYDALDKGLTSFPSCDAMEAQLNSVGNYHYYGRPEIMVDFVFEEMAEMDMSMPIPVMARSNMISGAAMTKSSFAADESATADDFSTTNIQVQGVDEGDKVKNDGKYIYMINDDQQVVIVEAYPAANMKEVARIEEDNFNPSALYVTEDKTLVVVGAIEESYHSSGVSMPRPMPVEPDGGIGDGAEPLTDLIDVDLQTSMIADIAVWPGEYDFQPNKTAVYVYDISDASNPTELNQVTYDGYLNTSRRIDGMLYLVLGQHFNYYRPMPYAKMAGPMPENSELYLPEYTVNGTTQNMADCGDIKYMPGYIEHNYTMVAAMDIKNYRTEPNVEVFLGNPGTVYASGDNLYMGITFWPNRWFGDWDSDGGNKTRIYKFAFDGKELEYEGYGKVEGDLLNQFSLDEHNGNLRVATTVWKNGNSLNNVYILNDDLTLIGEIEDIAPGERIYSTRFMGDRLYMVTFRQVDPLFAIDLKNPYDPKILGKLKIPGYSDYLHPYDENYILGFGKSGDEEGNIGGMKVALFDVTDPTNPTEKANLEIGDRGTESELLHNHKALLFSKSKNLLAFPITLREHLGEPENEWEWGEITFDGAYVYTITPEGGFEKRGNISHYTDEDMMKAGDFFPQTYKRQIQRILYMDDTLYGVSRSAVTAHTMNDVASLNRVDY